MHSKLYFILLTLTISFALGRLVHKNKTKATVVTQTEKPVPTIRLTRNIDNYHLRGFSKERTAQSDEFIQLYNKRARQFFKSKSKLDRTLGPKLVRIVRNSNKNIDNDTKVEIPIKIKKVLVKKPIPKFSDIDYEEEFQTKMSVDKTILGDSGDHEDEDFNLDDYDFDVNHDEFISGRKPLEPRLHRKNVENELTVKPEMKTQSKVVTTNERRQGKRERSADSSISAERLSMKSSKKEDYYYDEGTNKDTGKENRVKVSDNDYSEEIDDSKEIDHKPYVRSVRSWNVTDYLNKFGDKTSKLLNKLLGILPMFPQVPYDKNFDKNTPYL